MNAFKDWDMNDADAHNARVRHNAQVARKQNDRAATSERQLQDNISRLLRSSLIVFFWQRMDRRTTGVVGTPDYLFAVNGHACAFEVKMPGQKLTPEQTALHIGMRANGWRVWIIYNEREAVDALNEIEKVGAR